MRVLLTIEYNGRNYAGWQRQENALAVQQVLEDALEKMLQQKIVLCASGRTDAGVHAVGQKAHFDYEGTFPLDRIPVASQTILPDDIAILDAVEVSPELHAQYSAKKKTYRYSMYLSRENHPYLNATHAWISYDESYFDFSKMQAACKDLIGTHDFAGFANKGSHVRSTVRTVYDVHAEKNGREISVTITGNGFLYNMVRIIAGTLVYIGLGKRNMGVIKQILDTQNRNLAGKTFPPEGLCLVDVDYGELSPKKE